MKWPLGLLLALAMAACGTPVETDKPPPSIGITQLAPPRTAYVLAPQPAIARSGPPARVQVYLMPLDDFPAGEATRMAQELADELHLTIEAIPPMASFGMIPLQGRTQFSADEVLRKTLAIGRQLEGANENVVLIALTRRDINDSVPRLNFLFSRHDLPRLVSVVSTARLELGRPEMPAGDQLVRSRLYKMTKRAIGEQYFGMKRSTDRRDVMYAPLLSLDDLDTVGRDFLQAVPR